VESLIFSSERAPQLGAPKIREKIKRLGLGVSLPAISTVHAVLDRTVCQRGRRRHHFKAEGTGLSRPDQPNDLWCAITRVSHARRSRYCYPLTITDFASRTSVAARPPEHREHFAFSVFERTFKDYGLPRAIRSGQTVCLRQQQRLLRLSKLSVWWLRLGIAIERIKPAHPEQNGRHERMHLTLKKEATKPAGKNFCQQQAASMLHPRLQPRAPAPGF